MKVYGEKEELLPGNGRISSSKGGAQPAAKGSLEHPGVSGLVTLSGPGRLVMLRFWNSTPTAMGAVHGALGSRVM